MQPFPHRDPALTRPAPDAAPNGAHHLSKVPEYAYRVAIVAAVLLLLCTAG